MSDVPRIGPVAGQPVSNIAPPCPDCPPTNVPGQPGAIGGGFGPPPPFTNCAGANGSGFYPARLGLASGGSYCGNGNIFEYGHASPCNGWSLFNSFSNFTAGAFPVSDFYDRGDTRVGNHITFDLVGRGILTFWLATGQPAGTLNLVVDSIPVSTPATPGFMAGGPYITYDLTQTCTHHILITPNGGPTGSDNTFYFAGISWALI